MPRKGAPIVEEEVCQKCVQSKGRPHRKGCTAVQKKKSRSAFVEESVLGEGGKKPQGVRSFSDLGQHHFWFNFSRD